MKFQLGRSLLVACMMALFMCSASPVVWAEEDEHFEGYAGGKVYLSFQYIMQGPLYDKIYAHYKEDWEKIDPGVSPLLGIHEVDLNGDSLPEYIIRVPDAYFSCNQVGCHHFIVGMDPDGNVQRLATLPFAEVRVGLSKTDGVRDLEVYNNALNDYTPTRMVWDAHLQHYVEVTP